MQTLMPVWFICVLLEPRTMSGLYQMINRSLLNKWTSEYPGSHSSWMTKLGFLLRSVSLPSLCFSSCMLTPVYWKDRLGKKKKTTHKNSSHQILSLSRKFTFIIWKQVTWLTVAGRVKTKIGKGSQLNLFFFFFARGLSLQSAELSAGLSGRLCKERREACWQKTEILVSLLFSPKSVATDIPLLHHGWIISPLLRNRNALIHFNVTLASAFQKSQAHLTTLEVELS